MIITLIIYILLLSDLGNARVIIEAVLLIETITPYIYNKSNTYIYIYKYLRSLISICPVELQHHRLGSLVYLRYLWNKPF